MIEWDKCYLKANGRRDYLSVDRGLEQVLVVEWGYKEEMVVGKEDE